MVSPTRGLAFEYLYQLMKIYANREVAEGEGFEPSIRSPAYTLSKRAPSATRPPLLVVQFI